MSSFHFSSKVLNLVDTRPKADELKGAVKLDPNLKEYLQFGDESVKKSILINQSNCLNSTTFVTFSRQLNTHFIMRPTVLPQILVHLTEMLVGILGICSDSSSVARRFGLSKVPRFFRLVLQLERPFYDLFRILVELFCRTWKDMNAKFDEINKDQFERSLFENPNSLEQLEIEMLRKRFSYFNMQKN